MIWLVWNSGVGETEADADHIDALDCIEAAETWAQNDSDADTANVAKHLCSNLDLCARADGHETVYRITVIAEAEVLYSGRVRP